jgi:hypothetical protein
VSDFQIITIFIALLALIPATWIPLHIHRAKIFNDACIIFRAAFADELAFLVSDIIPQSSIHGTTYDILTKAFNKHKAAVDDFTRALPKRKRVGFNKAWKDYLCTNSYNKEADFPLLDYAEGDDFEKRKLAHSKITKLLEFAKPK